MGSREPAYRNNVVIVRHGHLWDAVWQTGDSRTLPAGEFTGRTRADAIAWAFERESYVVLCEGEEAVRIDRNGHSIGSIR